MSFKHRLIILVAVLIAVVGTFYPMPMHADGKELLSSSTDASQTNEDEVIHPKAVKTPLPKYPVKAKKLGLSAMVKLKVMVDEKGLPVNIEATEAYIRFDSKEDREKASLTEDQQKELAKLFTDAAVEAMGKWKFEPGIRNGIPIKMEVMVPVKFKLDG
jgi:protein TonB